MKYSKYQLLCRLSIHKAIKALIWDANLFFYYDRCFQGNINGVSVEWVRVNVALLNISLVNISKADYKIYTCIFKLKQLFKWLLFYNIVWV